MKDVLGLSACLGVARVTKLGVGPSFVRRLRFGEGSRHDQRAGSPSPSPNATSAERQSKRAR
jgi:hypothetical protein